MSPLPAENDAEDASSAGQEPSAEAGESGGGAPDRSSGPQAASDGREVASREDREPPRILEPVRTESGAFRALVWVTGGCLLVIALTVLVRAL